MSILSTPGDYIVTEKGIEGICKKCSTYFVKNLNSVSPCSCGGLKRGVCVSSKIVPPFEKS